MCFFGGREPDRARERTRLRERENERTRSRERERERKGEETIFFIRKWLICCQKLNDILG